MLAQDALAVARLLRGVVCSKVYEVIVQEFRLINDLRTHPMPEGGVTWDEDNGGMPEDDNSEADQCDDE